MLFILSHQKNLCGVKKSNKSPVQKIAENFSLNIRNPNFLNQNEKELEYFKSLRADIVIVVAYGQLIPKEFLSLSKTWIYKYSCISFTKMARCRTYTKNNYEFR